MNWLDIVIYALLILAIGSTVAVQHRYRVLRRRYKSLQRQYSRAEDQLATLWTNQKV